MKGIVDFYKTYPGMYIPSPLRVESFDSDSSLEDLCKEILGLTKMNWNNTQRMRPGITSCVIKPAATYAEATAQFHSPAASAGA
jgi:hypothetical protein